MRVLVTGMTTGQVGRPGVLSITDSFAKLLPKALDLAGHQVEHRPVEPGEALGAFNVVLVGIIGPGALAAGTATGTGHSTSSAGRGPRAARWGSSSTTPTWGASTRTCAT